MHDNQKQKRGTNESLLSKASLVALDDARLMSLDASSRQSSRMMVHGLQQGPNHNAHARTIGIHESCFVSDQQLSKVWSLW
ncbi:hypothetical protein BJS_04723 [Bradyrhizobium japonicum SEMIA 5079]|nr:hypothetical protein BJS_04723 [Bradyrhizobium japonicum SEMIA 5079]